MVQLAVKGRDLTDPPETPEEGDRYILPEGASGPWAGQAGRLAVYETGAWVFLTPREGWRARDLGAGESLVFEAGDWTVEGGTAGFENLPGVGVNASSDPVNRLSVSSAATLLSHEGAGHQLKLNKATAGDTASLLYQTGWSGRAEMGLAGDDAFSVKVSADGSAWTTALSADPATGRLSLPGGAAIGGALTGSAIVGVVAQSGGAVMESGSNANGSYLRLADGTQICTTEFTVDNAATAIGALFMSPTRNWTFPAAFVGTPALFGTGGSTSRWVGGIPATAAIGSLRVLSPVSVSTSITANAVAVGRWF